MIKSEEKESSGNLLDVLLRTQIHQLKDLQKCNEKITELEAELKSEGGLSVEAEM